MVNQLGPGMRMATVYRGDPPGTRGSTHVQLMSARTPVQITTAPSVNLECRLGNGIYAPYPEIAAPFAHGALTLRPRRQPGPLGPPSWRALWPPPVVLARVGRSTSWPNCCVCRNAPADSPANS